MEFFDRKGNLHIFEITDSTVRDADNNVISLEVLHMM